MTDTPYSTIAQELAPTLAATARATHEHGITCEAISTLSAAGLLRIYQNPTDSWGIHVDTTRILARSCATTAWIVTHTAEANRTVNLIGSQACADVRSAYDTIAILADSPEPITIERMGSNIIIDGRWPFVAGAGFANWLVLRGLTPEGQMAFLVPTAAVTSVPISHLGGLRGCDFHTVTAARVTLPTHHALTLPASDMALQRAAILGAILGGAEGGYADYLAMTKKRVSGTGGGPVAKLTQVQIRLAAAEADILAAQDSINFIISQIAASTNVDTARLARDGAVAAHRCLQAITQLVHQMGALGLAEFNPVQRHYRDLRVMATDARVNWDTALAAYGRQLLGVPEANNLPQAAA